MKRKLGKKNLNNRPEANPGDQYSRDNSVEDTFVAPNVDKIGSKKQLEKSDPKAAHTDTPTPFEYIKEAVPKFGDIADWNAHRAQKNERRKFIEEELEKALDEIGIFKQKSELAEQAKERALKDLDSTKRLIHQLKLNLERAETEESHAKQDSELARLRLQEVEQGIPDESSTSVKTQLEVAKARHEAAYSELVSATSQLEETRRDYEILISERDSADEKAREAVSAAKQLEAEVEDLMIQLITTKESIEYVHTFHLEAEEQRVQEVNELDHEMLTLDQELKQAEEELEKVKQQIALVDDLKSKLETASELLQSLKDELAVYLQGKMPDEQDVEKITRKDIQSGVAIAKKNLDEIDRNIKKTTEAIMTLKNAAESLTAELEGEKQVLSDFRKQNRAEAVTVLESELKRAQLELDNSRRKEKEAQEKLVELPTRLQKATEETKSAKLFAEGASLVLKKAKDAAEEAKNTLSSLSRQLAMTEREIEAARAQEKLALGAITALHESESARCMKTADPKDGITITLEEYYELSKQAHEAEELGSKRVAEATSEFDEAKESEMKNLDKLTRLNSEIAARREALSVALQKAEMAKESKSSIEEEVKKQNDETQKSVKKKRSYMPKLSFLFMGKKKTSSNKNS